MSMRYKLIVLIDVGTFVIQAIGPSNIEAQESARPQFSNFVGN